VIFAVVSAISYDSRHPLDFTRSLTFAEILGHYTSTRWADATAERGDAVRIHGHIKIQRLSQMLVCVISWYEAANAEKFPFDILFQNPF
jgi:hypothetical protein